VVLRLHAQHGHAGLVVVKSNSNTPPRGIPGGRPSGPLTQAEPTVVGAAGAAAVPDPLGVGVGVGLGVGGGLGVGVGVGVWVGVGVGLGAVGVGVGV